MASTPSRLPRRLLIVLGALVVLVGAAYAAVRVLLPPERVHALVKAQLAGVLARDVRYTDVSVSLWPPVRITVSQPGLAELGGFERGAIVEALALNLDLDVPALLTRRIVVRRLVLDRPKLHLVMRADGTTNLDGVMKPAPAGKPAARPMDLELRELRIVDGRVLVDDQKAKRRVALSLGTRVALAAEGGGTRFATSGETEITDLRMGPISAARLSDLSSSLAKLDFKIGHEGKFDATQKRLALGKLSLDLGRTALMCSGIIDEPGPHARIDLRAKGSGVDLGAVLGYLAAADAKAVHGVSGAGKLDFDLRAVGRLGAPSPPALIGALRVANGSFRYAGAPASVEALAFSARFAPDSITIGDLRARVGDQPLVASLFATRLTDPWVRFAVQGDVDLAAVAPMFAPPDTKLGGRMAVNVRGSGRAKDPSDLALDGAATLRGVSVQSPTLPNKVEDVHGEMKFSQSRASVTGFGAKAGKSSFTLNATVTRPLALLAGMTPAAAGAPAREPVAPAGVTFDLASTYLDLAEIMPASNGAPVLPNATGTGHVSILRLKNQKLDVQHVLAQVALEPHVVSVPQYSLDGYGGKVSGQARFDLRDPARPAFNVKSKVDSIQADALLSAWTPVKNLLHGSMTSDFDLSGSGATPADLKQTITAVGLALVANGTLGPGPTLEKLAQFVHIPSLKTMRFQDAKVPFRVERGRVVTDPVTLHGSHGDWKLIGSIGFDGTLDYAVSATLPREVAAALGANAALAAGALADEQGRIFLDLSVRGPAQSPQIGWDTRAMRDRLAGKVSQAIEDQRAKLENQARAEAEARTKAAQDSARAVIERAKQAAADSLKHRVGDVFKGFFGRDTTKH